MDEFVLVVWASALLCAWMVGEYLAKLAIPRIVSYGVFGLLLGEFCRSMELYSTNSFQSLADIAMGLLLCELGFRANPSWIIKNPWVLAISLLESMGTFIIAFAILYIFAGVDLYRSAVVSCLCIATSPGAILRISRNGQSSGPLTNAMVNLTALNCTLATVLYKLVTGITMHSDREPSIPYTGTVAVMAVASVAVAVTVSVCMKSLMNPLKLTGEVRAFAVAMSVILMTLVQNWLRLSPVLGALAMGFSMRHLGIKMTGIHQDFGSLGRTLNVFLFVFIGSRLEAITVWNGLGLGMLIGMGRAMGKILSLSVYSHHIGLKNQEPWLLGLGMLPASAFTVCLLEQAKWMGIDQLGEFPPLVSMLFLFEILGPLGTSLALSWSKENLEDSR